MIEVRAAGSATKAQDAMDVATTAKVKRGRERERTLARESVERPRGSLVPRVSSLVTVSLSLPSSDPCNLLAHHTVSCKQPQTQKRKERMQQKEKKKK